MSIKKYDKENYVVKRWSTLEKGDVFKVEYGDFDNWVTVVVEKVEKEDKGIIRTVVHHIGRVAIQDSFEMYGFEDDTYLVIGREE